MSPASAPPSAPNPRPGSTDAAQQRALSAADWAQVKALFDEALALPAAQRVDYLLHITAGAEVRAEVLSLLAHAEQEDSPLDHRATDGLEELLEQDGKPSSATAALNSAAPLGDAESAANAARTARTSDGAGREGERLGPWRIERRLGSGGMGEVWLAQRADGAYNGSAAIKVLRRGMDSAAVLGRFAQEQQALARLKHPHIAQLMDAGRTPDGLPYFVMEAVQGQAIDKACEGLPLEERLALFLQLTDAVAHAHRNLLVHRDLKPSNVLVDAQSQVKLLDFGIAKALDPLDGTPNAQTARAALAHETQAGERPYTPHFASPEQVRGEPVSTATDIYSLGVLLYVLLTGQRPYGRSATTPHEAARCVLSEDPTRPSALSPGLVADPQWLSTRKRLRGDLDNILLKALDKTIERRYPSAEALAGDIRAHLAGYPVSARPASAPYLAGRFIARNKALSALALSTVLAILGGAAAALWQAHQADVQRQMAERRFNDVRSFARTMLFDVDQALRDGVTAGREKLVVTALQYLDGLSAERSQDADLLRDVAQGYERVGEIQGGAMHANLGRPDDAQQSLRKALVVREKLALAAPDDERNLRGLFSAHERLGDNARAQRRLPDAARHYAQAVTLARTLERKQPGDLALQLQRIQAERYAASIQYWPFNASLGQYATALPQMRELAAQMNALLAAHPTRTEVLESAGGLLNQWSDFQRLGGDFAGSLQTQRQSHQAAEKLLQLSPQNPRSQRWLYLAEGRLADALLETGEREAGLAMWQRSIARREKVATDDAASERAQRNVANGYGPLAEHHFWAQDYAKALPWYEKENALLRRLRQQFPQVQALVERLDESDRDLALTQALLGQVATSWPLSQALQLRRSTQTPGDPALEARFALAHARVLLAGLARGGLPQPAPKAAPQTAPKAAPGTAQTALETDAVIKRAVEAVSALHQAARAEPFNAFQAREAAAAAFELGLALHGAQHPQACNLMKQGAAGLEALVQQATLPANAAALLAQARQRPACAG